MKKKKNIIILLILFISIGVTIAYLQSTDTFENIFNAGTYSVTTHEEFISPTNWSPGNVTPKTITTTNQGTIPVMVRVRLEEIWLGNMNNELPLYFESTGDNALWNDEYSARVERIALINFDNVLDWKYKDGYYYYKYELNPNESTKSLLKSVTFNPSYKGNIICHKDGNGNNLCENAPISYLGGTYHLAIIIETVQSNQYKDLWNIDLDQTIEPNECTYEGELEVGAEYVNGQYTYIYKKNFIDEDLENDGWSVYLTDKESTNPVTTKLCTKINNKPITSMAGMFAESKASSIDLSSFNTSNVTDMRGMFSEVEITDLDFSNFDTSNVKDMSHMFYNFKGKELDFSSFDLSNLENVDYMFQASLINKLTVRSENDANILKDKLYCPGIAFYVLTELITIDGVC